jgi:hypothetical protein
MASNANVYARIRQLIADRIWDKMKQNEEKLRQKEEEIRQIMITLSWKITTPLMWFGNILIKAGIMKDRGGK